MGKFSSIFVLLCLVVFTQCRPKPLDVNLPPYEPKVVVASQVLPGEIMFIGLTRSFTVLSQAGSNGGGDSADFANVLVDSALVTVEHSGIIDTLVKFSPGIFASIQTLDNPGTIYTLKVKDYDLGEEVSSTTEMLEKVDFDTVYPIITKSPDDTVVTIKTEFTDDPSTSNFYMINVYSREILNNGLDLNSFFDNGSNKVETTRIFTDAGLNPGKNSIDLEIESISATDSIAVALSNISEEYYNFLTKRDKGGNIFAEITSEPINYPTNINGGLGFFNTHFPDVYYFDLNEH